MVLKDRTFVPGRETGTDTVVSPASLGTRLPSRAHTRRMGHWCPFPFNPDFLESLLSRVKASSYDPYAQEVLDKLTNRAQTDLLDTTEHFLDLGRVRTDWLDSEEFLGAKLKEARGTEDTNYWLCMREVAREKKRLDHLLKDRSPIFRLEQEDV